MNDFSTLEFASDRSILIKLGNDISKGTHIKVVNTFHKIYSSKISGIQSIHPAYNSILVTFDSSIISPFIIKEELTELVSNIKSQELTEFHQIEIPVCYENEYASDIIDVAKYNNLSVEEVIHHHTKQNYLVYFLGFSPGFAYLGGMPKEIATPRLQTPRLKVTEGSVAIGGDQTGIYPISSPGGWRIIGRTPFKLFFPDKKVPTLLQMGDYVKFVPITKNEFDKLLKKNGGY
jgi:KipI family sensor histidine kinase inhibitor